MRIAIAGLLLVVGLASTASAVGTGKAQYMGGTVPGIKAKTHGPIDLTNADRLLWIGDKGGGTITIPWSAVESMEYGQKVGRRWRSAILLSPIALFSKARKHYVTLSYKDSQEAGQAAVFEFDKNDIRSVLAILKAKTGKEVAFQDDEAREKFGGAVAKDKDANDKDKN